MLTNQNNSNLGAVSTAAYTSYSITGAGVTSFNTPNKDLRSVLALDGENADVIINGKSLSKQMEAINERLLILEPNKELLEQYESLREAYNQYKMLEALLTPKDNQ